MGCIPTVFARSLIRLGLLCVLMSPSKTERKPYEKIITDKRAPRKIAQLFRKGDGTSGNRSPHPPMARCLMRCPAAFRKGSD